MRWAANCQFSFLLRGCRCRSASCMHRQALHFGKPGSLAGDMGFMLRSRTQPTANGKRRARIPQEHCKDYCVTPMCLQGPAVTPKLNPDVFRCSGGATALQGQDTPALYYFHQLHHQTLLLQINVYFIGGDSSTTLRGVVRLIGRSVKVAKGPLGKAASWRKCLGGGDAGRRKWISAVRLTTPRRRQSCAKRAQATAPTLLCGRDLAVPLQRSVPWDF